MGDERHSDDGSLPPEFRELSSLLEKQKAKRERREKRERVRRAASIAGAGILAGQALYSAGRWAYRKATQQGPTGLELVGGFAPELASDLTSVLRAEEALALRQDHGLAFLRLASSVERVVRDGVYMAGLGLTPHVIEGLSADKKAAAGLKKATKSRPSEPTLWVLRLWLRGLAGAMAQGSEPVNQWVAQAYSAPSDVPYADWACPERVLVDPRLPEFLRQVGDERNRLSHGRGGAPIDGAQWTDWCKLVLGSTRLEPWLAQGASPDDHRPEDGGWLSRVLLFMPTSRALTP